MNPGDWRQRRHVVPADVFAALAAGDGGRRAIDMLVGAQRSKRLLLIRAVLDRCETDTSIGDRVRRDLLSGYRQLAGLHEASPAAAAAVERMVAYPSVGAWAMAMLKALIQPHRPAPDAGYLAAVAAAAAVRAGVSTRIIVPVTGGRLVLPTLGMASLPVGDSVDAVTVRTSPHGAVIEEAAMRVPLPLPPGEHNLTKEHSGAEHGAEGGDWTPVRVLRAVADGLPLEVLVDHTDPFVFPHRDRIRRLTDVAVARWQDVLTGAWSLLAEQHRDAAEEMAGAIAVLVPLTASAGRSASATFRHAFGAVALSDPPDDVSLAATLVHEVQHNKLGALLDLVTLLDDPGERRWFAPWRDEPRPLASLLQGAYAHLGVAGFWRVARTLRDGPDTPAPTQAQLYRHIAFARWREATWEAVETLRASGALTAVGHRFVDGMSATLTAWRREPVPAAAADAARLAAERHRRAWKARYGTDATRDAR